nr:NACHT domain-containing protein [Saccharothrix sp.]
MAEELVGLRRTELPGVSDQEWQRAVEAVRDVLNAVPWERLAKDPADLVNAERLAKRVPAADQELSAGGRAAYELLLAGCCAGLAELARSVDRIMRDLQVGVSDGVTELLERDAQRADDFELRYADYVIRTTSSFELFGVARGRGPGRHSFDRSYVSLAVARRTGQDDDALTGAGVSAATAFEDARRVLLRGSAGAGKTTFLRWLALTAARDGLVPFFVPLRQFADGPLPTPERILDTTAPVLAEEKPDRWVVGRFRDGRALLLVDGIDELGSERRAEAAQWLEDLVAAYPDARYVVSTRPSAVDENWLGGARFTTYDLLPMSAEGVRDFLTAWHDAARAEQPDFTAWLDECEHSLAETLATRADLRKLASSPLLCGLLCALHQDGGMHLPRDRKSLYDAALDLLLVRWHEQRGVHVDRDRFGFSKEEQLVVLQRFAYSLVRNSRQLVAKSEAHQWIGSAMRGLRPHDAEPSQVLQRFLERTGLLRESLHGDVQFVHRTFRDYLPVGADAERGAQVAGTVGGTRFSSVAAPHAVPGCAGPVAVGSYWCGGAVLALHACGFAHFEGGSPAHAARAALGVGDGAGRDPGGPAAARAGRGQPAAGAVAAGRVAVAGSAGGRVLRDTAPGGTGGAGGVAGVGAAGDPAAGISRGVDRAGRSGGRGGGRLAQVDGPAGVADGRVARRGGRVGRRRGGRVRRPRGGHGWPARWSRPAGAA